MWRYNLREGLKKYGLREIETEDREQRKKKVREIKAEDGEEWKKRIREIE